MSLLNRLTDEDPNPRSGDQYAVIIPAAGSSTRFEGSRRKKPFVDLHARAIWLRTVEHFTNREDVSEVVLVLAPDDITEFRERYRPNLALLEIVIAEGGASRAESVCHGIKALTKPAAYIAVHDAARPLLTKAWVTDIFSAAKQHSAAIPGVRMSSTVKSVDEHNMIQSTVDRSQLVMAQTPQVFEREVLEKAYEVAQDRAAFTDEASLVEASGCAVYVLDGWPMNIKITTRQDFEMAEALLPALPTTAGLADLV